MLARGRVQKKRNAALWSSIVQLEQTSASAWSKQLLKNSQHQLKKEKTTKCCSVSLFFLCLSVRHVCCILMHCCSSSPPLLGFRFCHGNVFGLFFFVHRRRGSVREGGATWGGWGVGWQTGDRPSSLSPPGICPLLPTPLLISSRPCAWQQREFEISPSPRVKNPKPYHFVNGYL